MIALILRFRGWFAIIAAIASVVLVWFFFFRSTNSAIQTLTVHPGHFLQQVSVSGKVMAAQNADLGFAQSGRVERIYVKVGDVVRAGDTLAYIENDDFHALVLQKRAAVGSAQAQLQSLIDGTRPEQIAIDESSVAAAQVSLSQANAALLDAIGKAYTAADDAVHNKVDSFFNNPQSSSVSVKFVSSDDQTLNTLIVERVALESTLAAWKTSIATLSAAGLSDAVAQAQANLASVTQMLRDANAALNSAVPSQNVSQTTIDTYIASVSTARAAVDTAQSALTTAQTASRDAATALATAQRTLALAQAGSTQAALDEGKAQVAAAQADVQSAQAQLNKTIVTAPFSGTITKVDIKEGETATPGVACFSLISNGIFQIESFVPEINVALIKERDRATVTLDAYGPTVPFSASVLSIDPAETIRDGVSTYRALLEFSAADARIRSGMTANVVITTQEKDGIISIPQGAVSPRDGKWFVEVRTSAGTTMEREVTIGDLSSSGYREIVSGLSDGNLVVLPSAVQ